MARTAAHSAASLHLRLANLRSEPTTNEVSLRQEVLREGETVAQNTAPEETPPTPSD